MESYQTEAPQHVSGSNEVMVIDNTESQFEFFKGVIVLDKSHSEEFVTSEKSDVFIL